MFGGSQSQRSSQNYGSQYDGLAHTMGRTLGLQSQPKSYGHLPASQPPITHFLTQRSVASSSMHQQQPQQHRPSSSGLRPASSGLHQPAFSQMTPPDELLPAGVPPASQYQPHAPAAGFRLPSMAQPIGGRQALAALHAPARPATAPAGGAPMLAHLTNGAGRFPAALPMAGSAAGGAGRPSLLQGLELDQNPQTQPPAGQAPAQATPHLQPSQPPPKPPHAIDSELLRQLAEQVQQLEGGLAKCSSSVEALTTAVMERIAHVLERLQAQQQLLQAQADAAEAAAAARSSVRLMDAACQAEAAWRADAACQTDAAPQAPVLRSPSPASQPAMGGAAEGSATRQSRRPADGDAGMLLGSGGGAPLASAAAPTTLQPPAPGQAPAGCHASPCAVQQLPPAPPPGGGGGARQGTRQQHNMVQTVLPFGGAAAQRVRVPSASKAGSRGAANGATRHSSRLASAAAAVAAAGTEPAEKRGGRAVASAANSTGGAGLLKCRRTDMPPLPASEQGKRRRDDQAGGGAQPAQKRQLSSVVQLFAPAASPSAASADARQVVGALHLSPDPPSPTAECSIGNIDNTAIARQVALSMRRHRAAKTRRRVARKAPASNGDDTTYCSD